MAAHRRVQTHHGSAAQVNGRAHQPQVRAAPDAKDGIARIDSGEEALLLIKRRSVRRAPRL